MEKRDLEPDNCKMLVTADGGGGFFTVGLSVIDHNAWKTDLESPKVKRAKYSEGVAAKQNKDTSVKKMFVLAKIPAIDENHTNMSKMLTHLDLSGVEEVSETIDGIKNAAWPSQTWLWILWRWL